MMKNSEPLEARYFFVDFPQGPFKRFYFFLIRRQNVV